MNNKNKQKWTRNQKILLFGIIVSIVVGVVNGIISIKTQNQQIVIKQDLDEVKGKVAKFEKIFSNLTNTSYLIVNDKVDFTHSNLTADKWGITQNEKFVILGTYNVPLVITANMSKHQKN